MKQGDWLGGYFRVPSDYILKAEQTELVAGLVAFKRKRRIQR